MQKALTIKRRTFGFTLVELLMVAVIVALLAGAFGWSVVKSYKKMALEGAAKDIMLAAKYARIAAIEKQKTYELAFNVEERSFVLVSKEENPFSGELELMPVSNEYTKPGNLEGNVIFEKISISPVFQMGESEEESTVIAFNPDGTCDAAVIQIGNDKDHYTIYVSPATGKAKIAEGEADETMTGVIDLDAIE